MRILIACFLLSAATPALAASAPSFDGLWSVEGTTDVGPCEKTIHGEIRIEHNDIVAAEGAEAQAVGSIDNSGSVWARLTSAAGQARANGRFHGASASGAWSSNTAYCGGRWTARKAR